MEDSVACFEWTVAPAGAAGEVLVSRRPWRAELTGLATALLVLVLLATVAAWRARCRRDPGHSAARREAYRANVRPLAPAPPGAGPIPPAFPQEKG